MEHNFIPKAIADIVKLQVDPDDDYIDSEKLIKPSSLPIFQTGQIYEDEPAKAIECRVCGATELIVGRGSYITIIKCPDCNYELTIHEG